MHRPRQTLGCHFLSALLFVIFGCASPAVFEPAGAGDSGTDVTAEASRNPNYSKLLELLKNYGYEGAGLQYETDATLQLLVAVFNDARSANRDVKQVYTGVALAYDAKNKSLTIGGTLDREVVLKFIDRSVPHRAAAPTSSPTP